MPTFHYRARDRMGKMVAGAAIFESEEEARAFLRANRLMALELTPEDERGGFRLDWLRRLQKIDLIPVIRQLAIMLRTGVPLDRSFDVLLDQDHHPRLTDALRQASRDVRAGASLSESFERHPRIFPEMLTALIRAGESGGVLESSLEEAARQMVWQRELQQKVITAMTYPAFILLMAVLMVLVMLTFVVPNFVRIYESAKVALPVPTQMLLASSKFITTQFPLFVILVTIAVIGVRRYIETKPGQRQLDDRKLRLPLVGKTIRKVAVANFCRTLALLLDAGVPILDALRVSANASGNVVIRDSVMNVSEEVTRGHLLAQPLQRSGQFPPLVTRLIAVGEMTGVLPEVLREVVRVYTVEVDEELKRAVSLMEPMLMMFLAALIGGILAALYLPILNLSKVAAG